MNPYATDYHDIPLLVEYSEDDEGVIVERVWHMGHDIVTLLRHSAVIALEGEIEAALMAEGLQVVESDAASKLSDLELERMR